MSFPTYTDLVGHNFDNIDGAGLTHRHWMGNLGDTLNLFGTAATHAATDFDLAGAAAAALAASQPLDADLTTIASLTATTDNFLISVSSAWASRTPAQAKTTLALVKGDVGLGNVDNTADASKTFAGSQITSGTVPIGQLPTGTTSTTVPLGGVITGAGPTGDASHTLALTYNAAGQLTAVTNDAIAIAESTVANLTTDLAAKAPLASPTFTGVSTTPCDSITGLTGATALPIRFVGGTTTAAVAPTTGTFAHGDVVIGDFGGLVQSLYVCVTAGSPGTWASISAVPNGTAGGDLTGSYPGPTIKASVSLTTPVIGAATGTSLTATGLIKSSGTTSGVGYATGAGGGAVQGTNKTTALATFNRICGTITWAAGALTADTTVTTGSSTNTAIAATDVVVFTHISGGTLGAYTMTCTPGAGSWTLSLHNNTPGSLNEQPVFAFAIIKAVTA